MRADTALVQRGLARSRAVARELIEAGRVSVGGAPVGKASTPVDPADLAVAGPVEQWVGRAAYKLLGALEAFPVDPAGRRCIDVGASTGGFTQVLLAAGAASVVALDVGHDQLAAPVRDDPRVTDLSGCNVRDADVVSIGGPFDIVVADLSFISLRLVLDRLAALTQADGDLITLIKPQFEVGRERLARTGVVTSGNERRRVVTDVLDEMPRHGLYPHAVRPSPIEGGNGNHEYLLWATHRSEGKMTSVDVTGVLQAIADGSEGA